MKSKNKICILFNSLSTRLLMNTSKSKNLHEKLQQTANVETSGFMRNPIVGLKLITSGDPFMSLITKL